MVPNVVGHLKGTFRDIIYLCAARAFSSGTYLPGTWDCGSPVFDVLDHGRHVMSLRSLSSVPLKTCRVGQQCMLNLSISETSSR
ncbi:hypothetical protein TNCV_4122441 [Trichonephila clavipes]|nr:hypothetical protein TNCV_4122441 [Trichonephila clavipes]